MRLMRVHLVILSEELVFFKIQFKLFENFAHGENFTHEEFSLSWSKITKNCLAFFNYVRRMTPKAIFRKHSP